MVEVFDIVGRRDFVLVDYEWSRDLSLGIARLAESKIVIENGWTLFSFNFEKSLAIFLDVGAACDLALIRKTCCEQFDIPANVKRHRFLFGLIRITDYWLGQLQRQMALFPSWQRSFLSDP
jgi:hypothetical protein